MKGKSTIIKAMIAILMSACILCACGSGDNPVDEPAGPERTPELNENGKEEITICSTFIGLRLEQAIIDYNAQSSRYEIVPVEAEWGSDFDAYRTRIQLELTNGGGPDILLPASLQSYYDIVPYVEKGIFVDVTDFLEEQGIVACALNDSDINVNGRLYGIPETLSIGTMVTSEKLAVDNEDWTVETCMQVMRDSGVPVFCQAPYGWTADQSGLFILQILGVGNRGLFVDEEQRISSFEQPEFIEMLEFCKTYADPISQLSLRGRISSGEIAFVNGGIRSFWDFWYYEALFGGNPVYMGRPTPQGGRNGAGADDCYYINTASAHKEGALDFMKFLLSDEQQQKLVSSMDPRFPVKQELLETMWKEAKEELVGGIQDHQFMTRDGATAKPRLMTDEEEQFFWSIVNQTETAPVTSNRWGHEIWDIVEEEAGPFFSGEKSAEEVAEVIDNRVQLLLDEK